MEKEVKEVLSNIQYQLDELNKKVEKAILTSNNGNYTYTSESHNHNEK
ncbi:hypothetical protein [Clostridium botulinum]|nr:hypothetical protein [Clostridium botulinum]AEB76691.1 putative prophage LambdaBa02, lipoprotein [Clostridium botulinum BKT015925]MCD3198924.1 hypothetical protein [Clostridium botulinum C/D]MCD3203854.1 hypothetical protein [Clostridium botulinum C/D]MCD3212694.1 hypothetical protein [Clostridium botulinum C/D]MCD3215529.1 hypothetical protein [Clostridium botulinum C/D]